MSRRTFWIVFLLGAFLCGALGALMRPLLGSIVYVGSIAATALACFMLIVPATGSNKDTFFQDKFLALLAILLTWFPYLLI